MAAADANQEAKKPVNNDAAEAKARLAQQDSSAHDRMLRETQGKPITAKDKAALADTEALGHDIVQTFKSKGATDQQALQALNQFVNAKDDAGRAKVFTDAHVQAPDIVRQYEAKYGAGTTDAIRNSILLAKRVEASPTPAPQADTRVPAPAPARPADTQPAAAAPTDGSRVTDNQRPAPAAAASGDVYGNAMDALSKSFKTMAAVKADGNPLPEASRQVMQGAIDAASKITPDMISQQARIMFSQVPDWTQAKEQKYLQVNQAFTSAMQNLSQPVKDAVAKLPQGTSLRAQLAAAEKVNDPTAVVLKQADAAMQAFYKANPGAAQRDGIQQGLDTLEKLSHGKAAASANYAIALAKTGYAGDVPQAKALMNQAAQDKELTAVMPNIQQMYDGVMALGGPAAPAAQAADPLDAKVPGWKGLKAASAVMDDQALTPEQKIAKAAPLYEAALRDANSVKPEDIDKDKLNLNNRVKELTGGKYNTIEAFAGDQALIDKLAKDPANNDKLTQLNEDNRELIVKRQQSLIVSEAYAQALTTTAGEIQAKANGDPAHASKMNADANALSAKAVSVLQGIGQRDSNFGVAVDSSASPDDAKHQALLYQRRIQEEIGQAQRGEVIDPQKAAGVSGSKTALESINESIMGKNYPVSFEAYGHDVNLSLNPLRAIRPLSVGVNATIGALDSFNNVPVVGTAAHVVASQIEGFVPSPAKAMDGAAVDMANAKAADPAAAKAVIESQKKNALGEAAGTFSDVLSGQVGLQSQSLAAKLFEKAAPSIAEKAAPLLAKALPFEEQAIKNMIEHGGAKTKAVGFAALGLGAAFGSDYAAHALASDYLGTAPVSAKDIFLRSSTAFLSAHTANYLSEKLPGNTGGLARKFAQTAAVGAGTSTVFGLGQVNPFTTDKTTGKHYTVGDTLLNATENAAFGATSSMAGRALAPALHGSISWMGSLGAKAISVPTKFMFNSNAGREVVADASAAVEKAAARELPQVLPKYTGGFMGTSIRSTAARFVAGDVAGSAASTAFVNPWEKNEDTGKNYTWGETASHALTTGLATGSVFAAARVPDMVGGTIYRGATNLLPGEGGTLSRFMGTNAIAAGERFVAGGLVGVTGSAVFGETTDANGRPLTTGQQFHNALVTGFETGAVTAGLPFAAKAGKFVVTGAADQIGKTPLMAQSLSGALLREGIGFTGGAATSLYLSNGEGSFSQRLENAAKVGVATGSLFAVSPYVPGAGNATRRFLGRTAETVGDAISNKANAVAGEGTFIGEKVVAPINAARATVKGVVDEHGAITKQQILARSQQLGDVGANVTNYVEIKRLDKESDALLKAQQEQEARDKAAAAAAQQQQDQPQQ